MPSNRSAREARQTDPWLGQTIADRYSVRTLVGEGSMAKVYLAHDTLTGSRVALKRFKTVDLTARFLLRFRQAAYAAALLSNPRLVAVTDYALVDDAALVALEWMPHQSLATYLAHRTRVRPAIVGQIAQWLAEALAAIHQHHLLHLDFTPRNIFLDEVVGVRVADMGLARASNDTGLTATGDGFLHILPFLAPEQLAYSELTPATDIFAWGVVLFRAITGRYPFPTTSLAERLAAHKDHVRQAPPRPSDFVRHVPAALDAAVATALQYRPELRPADGTALLQRLQAELADTSDTAMTDIIRATAHDRAISAKPRTTRGERRARRKERTGR